MALVNWLKSGGLVMRRKCFYRLMILSWLSVLTWGEATSLLAQPRGAVTFSAGPPPPMRRQVAPPPPGRNFAWEQGFWSRGGGNWVWVPGTWAAPPRPSAVWMGGRWVRVRGGWQWRP